MCARDVLYWVNDALAAKKDPGFDYQHMGLTADVYDVLRVVQPIALAAQRSDGDAAARRVATDEANRRCDQAAIERSTDTQTGGGWPR